MRSDLTHPLPNGTQLQAFSVFSSIYSIYLHIHYLPPYLPGLTRQLAYACNMLFPVDVRIA